MTTSFPTRRTSTRHSAARALAAFVPLVFLAACGGGGGDAGDPNGGATLPVGSGGTSTDTTAYIGDCNVPNFVADTVAQVNAFRAQPRVCGAGAGATSHPAAAAVVWNNALARAAAGHSADMVARNFFAHTTPDGVDFQARIEATGYTWSAIGENLAAGPTTMTSVMTGWQGSQGHCANLMSPSFTQVGLSCKRGSGSNTYTTYWTMELARPR